MKGLVIYMKRIAAIALAAIMMIGVFSGCSGENGSVSTGSNTAGAFSENDLYLVIGGTKYTCDVYVDEITKAFGDGYQYSEGMSCAYDGMDKIFTYPELDVYTRPDGDKDIVIELCSYGSDVTSSAGIKIGSSGDDVKKAYGEPDSETSRLMSYKIAPASADSDGASLYFKLDSSGTVTAIGITAEVLIGE